jgi:hypothetical protein
VLEPVRLAKLIIAENGWVGGGAMIALPPFWQLVALLATHWVGDFVFQTNFQASNQEQTIDPPSDVGLNIVDDGSGANGLSGRARALRGSV